MSLDLKATMTIATAGLKAQGARVKVIAENLANANSTANVPGGDPYRRKMVMFASEFDRALGADVVAVKGTQPDRSDFRLAYEPGHPAADAAGYVKKPNVTGLVEMMDMREARRSYEANVNMIEASRTMMMRTIDLLR